MSNEFSLSIVIPVLNESANLANLIEEIEGVCHGIRHEILLIDDGSTDGTLDVIRVLHADHDAVKYVSFTRNFGHQAALKGGLDRATGDCVVMMDGDLQHPAAMIPEMLEWWQKGFDVVATKRAGGKEGLFKRLSSGLFYRLINGLSDTSIEKGSADFRLIDKRVVDILKDLPEQPLFFRSLVNWLGFKQKMLLYTPQDRGAGKSGYTTRKMVSLSLSGITGFSIRPLRISSVAGVILSGFAILYGLYALYIHFFTDRAVTGWTSLMVLISFIGGMQMIMIGVLGEYLGKLFLSSKQRPHYVIKEQSDFST